MALPKDPIILLSYVNTALRDKYSSLEEMSSAEGFEPEAVLRSLGAVGYSYDDKLNKFV